jgi:hypothetical protein
MITRVSRARRSPMAKRCSQFVIDPDLALSACNCRSVCPDAAGAMNPRAAQVWDICLAGQACRMPLMPMTAARLRVRAELGLPVQVRPVDRGTCQILMGAVNGRALCLSRVVWQARLDEAQQVGPASDRGACLVLSGRAGRGGVAERSVRFR